jgi:predicted transcriptional regulator
VGDDETIQSLAKAKGLNIEFSPKFYGLGSEEIKIGDTTIDLTPLNKKPTTAAEIKENKEDIKVIQNRILEILEEQDLYKKTK